jgi:prevent-host-death family protein
MTSQRVQLRSSPSSPKPKRTLGSRRKGRQSQSVALAKVKDDLSHYLRLAADQEIVITRHGRPAGILIGFDSEEAWFEYRLEHHPDFLARIQNARGALHRGEGVRLEDIPA